MIAATFKKLQRTCHLVKAKPGLLFCHGLSGLGDRMSLGPCDLSGADGPLYFIISQKNRLESSIQKQTLTLAIKPI
jgi:hypothetical protein